MYSISEARQFFTRWHLSQLLPPPVYVEWGEAIARRIEAALDAKASLVERRWVCDLAGQLDEWLHTPATLATALKRKAVTEGKTLEGP